MGLEITKVHFELDDYMRFNKKLITETDLIKKLCTKGLFVSNDCSIGTEIESWIFGNDGIIKPYNQYILDAINQPDRYTTEISKYNLEMNGAPFKLTPEVLESVHSDLQSMLDLCEKQAKKYDSRIMLIGSMPNAKEHMFNSEALSEKNRYKALVLKLYHMHDYKPVEINIDGKLGRFHVFHETAMMVSSTTSFQVHIKVEDSQFLDHYNAAQLLSAASVALSSNSPYVCANELWEESRIPLFEHAVSGAPNGKNRLSPRRVYFGSSYLRSRSQIFSENLDEFIPLMPFINENSEAKNLFHVSFQNGTIWRWNRPVIGQNEDGSFHIRLEHRPMSSGPTVIDMTANLAFFLGVTHQISKFDPDLIYKHDYKIITDNFYRASKNGLTATLNWLGKDIKLNELLIKELIPRSVEGLKDLNISKNSIDKYMGVVISRVETGQTGAVWQREFVKKEGNIDKMCIKYLENQETKNPVHTWSV